MVGPNVGPSVGLWAAELAREGGAAATPGLGGGSPLWGDVGGTLPRRKPKMESESDRGSGHGPGRVVNVRHEECDVYAGRPHPRFPEDGGWGNPLVVGKDGTGEDKQNRRVLGLWRLPLWR